MAKKTHNRDRSYKIIGHNNYESKKNIFQRTIPLRK